MKKIAIAALIFISGVVHASVLDESFSRLKRDVLPYSTKEEEHLLFYRTGTKIHVDRDNNALFEDDMIEYALETSVSTASKPVVIGFSYGPSADPVFHFYLNGKAIGEIGGTEIAIPGDGFVYVTGEANDMFLRRSKYQIRDGMLVPVRQPFFFVGLDSIALSKLQLYSDRELKSPTEIVDKDERIIVILNDGDRYLVRNGLGFVGWISVPNGTPLVNSPIKDLYFRGD